MKFETLEDKCKYYQGLANYKLMPNSYILCHIDGRAFGSYCRQFDKPFDDRFISIMNNVAQYVCTNVSGCRFGYVQSDEISLVVSDLDYDKKENDSWFGYRINKMCSIIGSLASTKFVQESIMDIVSLPCSQADLVEMVRGMKLVEFDCKVWNVPTYNDVFCWLLYRQNDCIRNSKQMVSQAYFKQKMLSGKNVDKQIQMVKEMFGVDWNSFCNGKKFGRFVVRKPVKVETEHGVVERNKWVVEEAYSLNTNKEKFVESGIIPRLELV